MSFWQNMEVHWVLGKYIKGWDRIGRDGPHVYWSGKALASHPPSEKDECWSDIVVAGGVWEGKDEKGVRYIGSTPECPEAGQRMYAFIYSTNIYSALILPGYRSELNISIISALMEFIVQNFSIWINLLTILVLFSLNEWNQSNQ